MATQGLNVADYVVMAIFVGISSLIGFYYGLCTKQRTTEEYLLGGRRMHLLPVAISLAVTFQSAISIMGTSAEIYMYHTMGTYGDIGFIMATIFQAFAIVPLIHPLKLTSSYEYLYLRFESRAVQLLATVLGMLQTLLYISIVLFTPALALEAVVNIPLWLSIVVMGAVGTIYTAIGGMRSVIWTDVFQFMMLYGGITVVLIMAGVEIGSLSKIFSLADEGKRIRFDIISGDPRVRHTVWGCIINGLFNSLPNFFGQSSIQRISSIKIQKDAERSALLNIPISMFFILVLQLTGISVFAYFSSHQCDPLESGQIENPNQLVPFFVMNVLSSTPGLTGIFLAAMFSASLSSLSSGISSLTANTLQDLLPYCLKNVTQTRKTAYAKLIALCYGCAVVGVAYLLRRLHGPVGQITAVAVGSTGGPAVGLFLLGATSPFPDWVAALVGGVVGVAFTAYLSITTTLYRQPDVTSAPISTSGCFPEVTLHNNVSLLHDTYGNHTTDNSATTTLASRLSGVPFSLYDISYVYIGMVGTIVTFLVGLSVTFCIVCIRKNRTRSHCSSHLLFPFMRRFWNSSTQHKSKNELGHKMRVEVDEEVTAVEQNESKVESVKL